MNTDTLEGQWKQIRGKVQQQWGKLTNDDLDRIEGREELVGIIQERYGEERSKAERDVDTFMRNLKHEERTA